MQGRTWSAMLRYAEALKPSLTGIKGPKVGSKCAKKTFPNTTISLHCWHKAVWIHGFMLLMPNSLEVGFTRPVCLFSLQLSRIGESVTTAASDFGYWLTRLDFCCCICPKVGVVKGGYLKISVSSNQSGQSSTGCFHVMSCHTIALVITTTIVNIDQLALFWQPQQQLNIISVQNVQICL